MQNNKPIWFNQEQPKILKQEAKYKILVATPVHSDVSMHYCQAVLKFQQECLKRNILVSFSLLKSSLVQQGRNLCVAEFLNDKSNYTHLLFIDSDIDFESKTIFSMLERDKDIIACPYPMKTLNWDKMMKRKDREQIDDPNHMSKAGFTYPIKVNDPQAEVTVVNGVMEVTHAPTGCMLIKRKVIETMIDKHPELKIYQPTFINGKEQHKENLYNLFECIHDKETKRYFGEDFGFCQRWTDLGGKVYIYVMDYITHVGEHQYCGRFWDELLFTKKVDDGQKIK